MPPAVFENSYTPDSVNSIKWDTLEDETYQNVYNYYKGLIAFRKAHAGFVLPMQTMSTQTSLPWTVSTKSLHSGSTAVREWGNVRRHFCDLQSKQYRDIWKAFVKGCVDIFHITYAKDLSLLLPE